jgi:hypothetical protein
MSIQTPFLFLPVNTSLLLSLFMSVFTLISLHYLLKHRTVVFIKAQRHFTARFIFVLAQLWICEICDAASRHLYINKKGPEESGPFIY